ncbi:MAG: hypothetical protein E6K80_12945 [Candidatus Eisenbacteria bacterium]|uniref:DUF4398 domain-containing protein n=1 Tax=Eiseniibacteriota bacterium TaxID=2212470 RepID=A0A538TZJ9_UNCEI|nr:MAG: hypothetical protein E6K80_12945 [Candidatus Eisenbacteria bacterium]
MISRPGLRVVPVCAVALLWASALLGCAHARRQVGVPIDQRPTPPPASAQGAAHPDFDRVASTRESTAATSTATEREQTLGRIVADTTAASAAVRKCAASRSLLPDQQSVFDTTQGYLVQARAALRRNELWEAESLARKARQLALSLECH